MDQAAYQRWWNMHLRVARGDSLNSEETAVYNAGLHELERDEKLQEVHGARATREQLLAHEEERALLEKRRQQLESEIAALEERLPEQTRQLLGVEK